MMYFAHEEECYFDKMKEINGLDPYKHKGWLGDLNVLLQVTFPDVFPTLYVV